MERISDKKKCMASLAVFRELYNSEKDIYDVIAAFVKQLIIDKGIRAFELQEMKVKLNEAYGFETPSAVIRTALKRLDFLDRYKTSYKVNGRFDEKEVSNFQTLSESACQQNELIFESLFSYVEQRKGKSLKDDEREKLKTSFCSYVIDDITNTDESEIISAFLVAHKTDEAFVKQLNQIKQGVIIYVGLTYNANYDSVDAIDNPLHIYLETEVLFSMGGV